MHQGCLGQLYAPICTNYMHNMHQGCLGQLYAPKAPKTTWYTQGTQATTCTQGATLCTNPSQFGCIEQLYATKVALVPQVANLVHPKQLVPPNLEHPTWYTQGNLVHQGTQGNLVHPSNYMQPSCLGCLGVPSCLGALVPSWCLGALVPSWCLGALVSWCQVGVLVPWCLGAKLPWCLGAPSCLGCIKLP